MKNTINWDANTDSNFKDTWWKKCEKISEGPWGFKLRLFYRIFYGEGFIICPGQTYTREKDERPYAGIIWSGDGQVNDLSFNMDDNNKREFLVTPNSSVQFTNTSNELDLMIFTVFPMNI